MKNIECPKCKWKPNTDSIWSCSLDCLNTWNTFDTSGVCPKCSKKWNTTACLSCGEFSSHSEWYKSPNKILTHLFKSHLYKLFFNIEISVNELFNELGLFLNEDEFKNALMLLESNGVIKLSKPSNNFNSWTLRYSETEESGFEKRTKDYYNSKITTEQNINDLKSDFFQKGAIGILNIDCPKNMSQGLNYSINVSINKLITELKEINNNKKIPITPVMSVKLNGDDYEVNALSTEEQLIDDTLTKWSWRVKPLKSGLKKIRLIVSIKTNLEKYGIRTKDLPIYEEVITVKVNRKFLLKKFWNNNWKWLISLVLGSGVLWKYTDIIKVIEKIFK